MVFGVFNNKLWYVVILYFFLVFNKFKNKFLKGNKFLYFNINSYIYKCVDVCFSWFK